MMQVWYAKNPFHPFQLEKQKRRIQEVIQNEVEIHAVAAYWIAFNKPLSIEKKQSLETLLEAQALEHSATDVWVFPRLGTQSPWSSKAEDILKYAGFSEVVRIEHGLAYTISIRSSVTPTMFTTIANTLHDPLTESFLTELPSESLWMTPKDPIACQSLPLRAEGIRILEQANERLGLALDIADKQYLLSAFTELGRDPTDVELMMFAQANSEHCRHKIFNATWMIDGVMQSESLMDKIRFTYQQRSAGILTAYADNAAVLSGSDIAYFQATSHRNYEYRPAERDIVLKVETHNHPTAISPFAGAATGAGGEIRDEGATGRGGQPTAGMIGFSVSYLRIPGYEQPWEVNSPGSPERIATPLQIMLEAPLGNASFNNEFGRPAITGYFRTFEHQQATHRWYGYHKPILIAGGIGQIDRAHIRKQYLPVGTAIVVLGGPAMLIGLGGGAASSCVSGSTEEALDFASVQRSNPEMQRRCQEVINACVAMQEKNPILSLHDVGAGGLSNAIPELLADGKQGGNLQLRSILSADTGLSVLEFWCNEAQERYVLAIGMEALPVFEKIAHRERCPYAVVGFTTAELQLTVKDKHFHNTPIDVPLALLFSKPPKMQREVKRQAQQQSLLNFDRIDLRVAVERVLQFPAVASKAFLITIGDRSVGGLVVRDPCVGPWQVPVADVAVTCMGFQSYTGVAMAVGERAPLALINSMAAGRMAVAEALTNLLAAPVQALTDVNLSANWMAAMGQDADELALWDTVDAVAKSFCPDLGLTIPVGKDSLSMSTVWRTSEDNSREVCAPLSLVITAMARLSDVRDTLTPLLVRTSEATSLLLIDLGFGEQRLGASVLAQVYGHLGSVVPDIQAEDFRRFFDFIVALKKQGLILAYHDRSDGGLFITLCEMAFASHQGLNIQLDTLGADSLASLFNEELGIVIQVKTTDLSTIDAIAKKHQLEAVVHVLGVPQEKPELIFSYQGKSILSENLFVWKNLWTELSYRLRALRENPSTALAEHEQEVDANDQGLPWSLSFNPAENKAAPFIQRGARPKIAILREQGVNGHMEMAAAFYEAGFAPVDVHMTDILDDGKQLKDFHGLAVCGGFSYGDVFGAGRGWAQTILNHTFAHRVFADFFERKDTWTLGVCNGCQMLSALQSCIPGAEHWPRFQANQSARFESRLVAVQIESSKSIFFQGMEGSTLPIVVAHGEGLAVWSDNQVPDNLSVCLRYVDHHSVVTTRYPYNPNGSPVGITGITNQDGRVTLMMPHPERLFRRVQYAWHPREYTREEGPWLRLFQNARVWVG